MGDYLARLFGRGGGGQEEVYGHDAELFLDDLEMLMRRGEGGEGEGDENNDDDDDQQQPWTERNLTLSRTTSPPSPTLVVTYRPQLTQPLWADLKTVHEKDGHPGPLLVPAGDDGTVAVVDVDVGVGLLVLVTASMFLRGSPLYTTPSPCPCWPFWSWLIRCSLPRLLLMATAFLRLCLLRGVFFESGK